MNGIKEIILDVMILAMVNSFVIYGIKKYLKSLLGIKKVHRFVGLFLTLTFGLLQGFLIPELKVSWHRIIYGASIAFISIAIYESAVRALLNFIPMFMDKFFFSGEMVDDEEQKFGKG